MNAQLRGKLIFISIMLLSALVLLIMGLYITHVLDRLNFKYPPIHFLFHFGLYIIIFYSFLRTCIRIVKQYKLTLKWNRYFNDKKNHSLTKYIKAKYGANKPEICVVEHSGFIALTIGIFRPRIVLSSIVLTEFDEQEIEAIILHELYHANNYDPLKLFVVTIILDAINYIPITKVLVHNYKICKELIADQFAIARMKTSYGLSKALLKMNRIKKTTPITIGVGFANSTINFRIQQILEPENSVQIPCDYLKPLAKSCFVFTLMLLVFIE